jgi:hypothetical protein
MRNRMPVNINRVAVEERQLNGDSDDPEDSTPAAAVKDTDSPGWNAGVESTENTRHFFSPERRETLFQQIKNGIAGYDATGERAFGREHGHKVNYSTDDAEWERRRRPRELNAND